MSFVRPDGIASWGMVDDDDVVDCRDVAPTLRAALNAGTVPTRPPDGERFPLFKVTFLPPVSDPEKIICIGLNYLTHIQEGGREIPKQPTIFTRWANTLVGHLQPIVRPKVSETLDFEGEMAVVIGRPARYVPRSEAAGVVAGYSCFNDGSIREWQRHTTQFTPGKNFPGTGAFGPWILTPDEAGDISKWSLITRVNGEEMQRATLDDLVFDVPALIEYCSSFTRLEPGDVIITGTTGGVGAYRKPPLWLQPGDEVEVEVGAIGTLRNGVVQES